MSMSDEKQQGQQDKYILRFERPNHRAELKSQAALAKRSLNKQILHLIERGEESEKAVKSAEVSA